MTTPGEQSRTGASDLPFPTADNHDADAQPASAPKVEHPTEEALDHGIEESFPASDPVSVSVTSKLPASSANASGTAAVAGMKEQDVSAAIAPPAPTAPGDDAPSGTPGTGESLCRECGGSGRLDGGRTCPACQGSGKVNVGIGGG